MTDPLLTFLLILGCAGTCLMLLVNQWKLNLRIKDKIDAYRLEALLSEWKNAWSHSLNDTNDAVDILNNLLATQEKLFVTQSTADGLLGMLKAQSERIAQLEYSISKPKLPSIPRRINAVQSRKKNGTGGRHARS